MGKAIYSRFRPRLAAVAARPPSAAALGLRWSLIMGMGLALLCAAGSARAQSDDNDPRSRVVVQPEASPPRAREAAPEPPAPAPPAPAPSAPAPSAAPASSLQAEAGTPRRERPLGERHHRLGIDAGVASAVGWGGITYAYSPIRWVLFEAGAGYGISGTQLSLMPKLTPGSERNRFLFGPGYSIGIGPSMSGTKAGDVLHFINVDVGYEHRFETGFALQVAAGFWWLVHWPESVKPGINIFPQFRVGLGYWL
jgi:hypothetical protein